MAQTDSGGRGVQEQDLDGLAVLHVASDGPTRLGVLFRVGSADETLATRGLTHLTSHLVVHRLASADRHRNLDGGGLVSGFHATGSDEELRAFLSSIETAIQDPPLDRLATELSVIRGEDRQHLGTIGGTLLARRYGTTGAGLAGLDEVGLHALGGADVIAWLATRFTRENAVLWVAGPQVPSGLALTLPTGQWREPPTPVTRLVTPGQVRGDDGVVSLDLELEQNAATPQVIERMRHEITSAIGLQATRIRANTEHRDASVVGLTIEVVPRDIRTVVDRVAQVVQRWSEGQLADVPGAGPPTGDACGEVALDAAVAHLLGGTEEPPTDPATLASQAVDTLVVQLPHGSAWPLAGFTPDPSPADVTGEVHRSVDRPDTSVVVAPGGVTARVLDRSETVLLDGAVALAWPDGSRRLIGHDGRELTLDVDDLGLRSSTVAAIDAAVDEVVPQAARPDKPEKQREPAGQPTGGRPTSAPPPVRPRRDWNLPALDPVRILGWALMVMSVVGGLYLLKTTIVTAFDDVDDDIEFFIGEAVVWIAWGAMAWFAWGLIHDDPDEGPDE